MAQGFDFGVESAHREALAGLGLDSLAGCLAAAGGETVKAGTLGRDVRRFHEGPRTYYLKRVRGRGWREVLQEGRVLRRLFAEGFPVAEPVAVGAAEAAAVIVTVGLPVVTTLERVMLDESTAPARATSLLANVASVLSRLHDQGVNHRDFYAGHVLLDADDRVFLVDFGRAELRRRVPWRRAVKDVAALEASLPERVFPRAARSAFEEAYLGARRSRAVAVPFSTLVAWKSRRLRRHTVRKLARGEPNVHVNR